MSFGKRLVFILGGVLLFLIVWYFFFTGVNLNEVAPT